MSSIAIHRPVSRRNRLSLRLFAALFALALFAFTGARPVSAETCANAFANWTTGSRLIHGVPSSTVISESIAEWDSDVVKIRHNIAGLLLLGVKGAEVEGTLYVWDALNEEADLVGSAVLGGETGNSYSTEVEEGDYCLEITNHVESEGEYELNINFVDGCTLGTLAPTFCEQM